MRDGKHVILYVEDDPDFLAGMRPVLESGGYAMLEARSAEEGLRVLKREMPDLILLDLMMEEVDAGTEFVKATRAQGNEVPIYMVSSVGDDLNMTTNYADLGLDGILQKPVDSDALLTLLREALTRD
jgi:DNA-binding response OmpR family regulator